jgi:endonuclease/exonuclease/phosphatase (EEP) superfamily protein YafD
MDRKAFRFSSWNCRSHDRRRTVIEKLLNSNRVMLLQETKRNTRPEYDTDECHTFFKPCKEVGKTKRGLLTLVRKPMEVSEISTPHNNSSVETLVVSITVGKETDILVNLYAPGETLTRAYDWKNVLNPLLALGGKVIISGDFNARSTAWIDTGSNINGKALEEALPEINGLIVNNDSPTRVAERCTDTDSAIDITIVSTCLATEVNWKLLPLMGSDHRPVLTSIITLSHSIGHNTQRKTGFRYRTSTKSVIGKCRSVAAERRLQNRQGKRTQKPAWLNVEVEEA